MKKLFTFLLLSTFLGCGSLDLYKDYGTVKGWGYKEMPPSQVTTSGDAFYTIKLSDKSYSVAGLVKDGDGEYYYNSLWQDLGWYKDIDGDWSGAYNVHRPKRGHLYFHLKRGVAIYFYPQKTFNAFKVTLDSPTEDLELTN